jgi:hypothetical protein
LAISIASSPSGADNHVERAITVIRRTKSFCLPRASIPGLRA